MKKKSIIIAVAAVLAFCFCMSGCGSNESADTEATTEATVEETAAEDLTAYEGKTFKGQSPWEEDMSITVDKVDGNTVDLTYSENSNDKPLINETIPGAEVEDNEVIISFSNSGDENMNGYEMDGILTFQDGQLILKFVNGCKYENSSEGGSTYHNVEALSDDQKVVTLTCE